MDERGWNFGLAVIVGDRFPEKAATIGRAQRFERIGIQTRAADAREDREKQAARQSPRLRARRVRGRRSIYGFAGHRITTIVANVGK